MEVHVLSENQKIAFEEYISTGRAAAAARKVGVSRSRIYEWQKLPAWQKAEQEIAATIRESLSSRSVLLLSEALDALVSCMQNPNAFTYAAVQAAQTIIKFYERFIPIEQNANDDQKPVNAIFFPAAMTADQQVKYLADYYSQNSNNNSNTGSGSFDNTSKKNGDSQ